jgi:hypothetical protein
MSSDQQNKDQKVGNYLEITTKTKKYILNKSIPTKEQFP